MKTDSDSPEEETSSPTPRISWLMGGSALLLMGILMLISVLMTPVGIAVCAFGILLVVASFAPQNDRQIKSSKSSSPGARASSSRLLSKVEHRLEKMAETQAAPKDKLRTKHV